jgi:hypothetical protein
VPHRRSAAPMTPQSKIRQSRVNHDCAAAGVNGRTQSVLDLFRLTARPVVTGTGKGIGRGIILALAEAGADVAVNSRSQRPRSCHGDRSTRSPRTRRARGRDDAELLQNLGDSAQGAFGRTTSGD